MDKDDIEERRREIRRAATAERIVRSRVWSEEWDSYLAEIYQQWADSPPNATEDRERLWTMYNIAQTIRARFDDIVETGQWAAQQLEEAGESS